jgi:hypothetical protein
MWPLWGTVPNGGLPKKNPFPPITPLYAITVMGEKTPPTKYT